MLKKYLMVSALFTCLSATAAASHNEGPFTNADVPRTTITGDAVGQTFIYSTPLEIESTFGQGAGQGAEVYVGLDGFSQVIIDGRSASLKGFRYGQSGVKPDGSPDMKLCGFGYAAFMSEVVMGTNSLKSPLTLEVKDGKVFARNKQGQLAREFFFLARNPKNTEGAIKEFLEALKAQKQLEASKE